MADDRGDIPVNVLRYHLVRQMLGFFGAFTPVMSALHLLRHAGTVAPDRLSLGLFIIAGACFTRLMPSKFADTELYPKVRWRLALIYACAGGFAVTFASWMLGEPLDAATWTLIAFLIVVALALCLVFLDPRKAKTAHG